MERTIYLAIGMIMLVSVAWSNEPKQADNSIQSLRTTGSESVASVNYQDVRIKKFPFAMQCWSFRKFTFLETLQKVKELGIEYLQAYPGQRLAAETTAVKLNPKMNKKQIKTIRAIEQEFALAGTKFDHNLSDDQIQKIQTLLNAFGLTIVSYGVCDIGTTEASMRQIFDFAKKMDIKTLVTEPQDDDFTLLEKLVREYDINIAIHNHPEPSKYAKPQTVFDHVQGRDERIGSCADTGHWMRGGFVPVEALHLLTGRIVDLHLKDRSDFGTENAVDVPFGDGKANIHDILAELTLQNYPYYLTIEYENEDEAKNPSPAIYKGIQYVNSIIYYGDYQEILSNWNGRYNKHGWNHYGPGYFELNERTGVLKSQGGMGLLWYSVKKYKNFILELDYKCADNSTNSGVFLRVPELPTSDDYIYHSFEIQICDDAEGIHQTGAVYDAEAPRSAAFKAPGEWNHYKITCQGKRIQVELNNTLIIDWQAEPRGKVKDFANKGYIGLQNHDSHSPVYFRNIQVKELK